MYHADLLKTVLDIVHIRPAVPQRVDLRIRIAAFGKVFEGMDFVNAIAECDTNPFNDRPLKPQVMKTVTVDTFGVEYPQPETM